MAPALLFILNMTARNALMLFKFSIRLILIWALPILVYAQSRIGYYGGTFDPPHLGHRALIARVQEQLQLDEILIIPNYSPGHKPNATPFADRLAMARENFTGIPHVRVVSEQEAQEIARQSLMGTFWQAYQKNSKDQVYHIVGDDVLANIEKNSSLSFPPNETLVVNPRGQETTQIENKSLRGVPVIVIPGLDAGISSSAIRNDIALKNNTADRVAPQVLQYISQHNLYAPAIKCAEIFTVIP